MPTEYEPQNIIFANESHKHFFYDTLKKVRYMDEYHIALCYCLGINDDTRNNIDQIYDFAFGCVKPECLQKGWQTSGSLKVIRLAFNLYCNGTPSVNEDDSPDDQLMECQLYTVEDIFQCSYAPYFVQAIKLRYPEYFL